MIDVSAVQLNQPYLKKTYWQRTLDVGRCYCWGEGGKKEAGEAVMNCVAQQQAAALSGAETHTLAGQAAAVGLQVGHVH